MIQRRPHRRCDWPSKRLYIPPQGRFLVRRARAGPGLLARRAQTCHVAAAENVYGIDTLSVPSPPWEAA